MTSKEKLIILENQIEHIYNNLKKVSNYGSEMLINYSKALINLEYLAEELRLKILDEKEKERFYQYLEEMSKGEIYVWGNKDDK